MPRRKIKKIKRVKSRFLIINLTLIFLVVFFAILHYFIVFRTQKIQVLGTSIENHKLIPDWRRNINFSFSGAVDKKIVEQTFKIEPSVLGIMTWKNDRNLSIQLDDHLEPDTKYAVQFFYASAPLPFFPTTTPEIYNLQFQTGSAPYAISSRPADRETNVAINKDFVFNFDQKIKTTDFQNFFLVKPKIPGAFFASGNSVIFSPDAKLKKNTNYSVFILKGLPGTEGEQMTEDYLINFQTGGDEANKSLENPKEAKIPILMYHNVGKWNLNDSKLMKRFRIEPSKLELHLKYISENYQTVSIEDVYNDLVNGIPVPKNSIVLTFDDGWKGLYTEAFPILQKYHLRFTAYLVSSYLDNNSLYLTKKEVREMLKSGLMEIGNHTVDHALLGFYDREKINYEIREAENALYDDFGVRAKTFAYPGGSYNSVVLDVLENLGFKTAVTAKAGGIQKENEAFLLKRTEVEGTDGINELKKKIEM